ncbi:MAG: DNA-3-methyladenine glycosylase family protein [Saprospiraceae bacterium]
MKANLDELTLKIAADWLAKRDPKLAFTLEKHGYPPLWDREPGFATLVYIILEQQVSLASARSAFLRLKNHITHITPSNFLKINDEQLLQIGFSRQKKAYSRGLAEAVLSGEFDFEILEQMPEHVLRPYMKRLKGIGDWTVDIYTLMSLLRPDVLPKGDIALYESFRTLHGLETRPDHHFFEENTQHWRPWRSVGVRMLWHFYLCERDKKTNKLPQTH